MTAPWTPRERALREALEFYAKHEHWMQVCEHADNSRILIANGKYHTNGDGWEEAAAALADPPPPDPRDAALLLAEAELLRLWKLVPAGRAGVGGVRTIELEDDEVARLRQIVDAIRAAKGGA